MELPFFYTETTGDVHTLITLDEDASKHIVQSLRMQINEELLLTDGKGNLLTCVIADDHKKKCVVRVKEINRKAQGLRKISIAISLLKNTIALNGFWRKRLNWESLK